MIGIKEIAQTFEGTLSSLRKPANIISTIIMLCALVKRPGLSCMMSTSNILQNVAKQGCPTGPLPDGSPNLMNVAIAETVCEIFRALKEDANIQIAIPPGSVTVNVTGGNAGGPFTAVGVNVNGANGVGLMQ
jgi:hypothetical protein